MNAVNATDRVIVVLIALTQMVVCALFLFWEFGIAYGGGFHPFFTPFLFFGLFSAGLLFSQGLLPRIFAGAWQIIFAIIVFQFQANATTRFETFVALLASFYLFVTTVIRRYAARPKSSSEAMR